ncbi:phosphoglycerate kinase [Desulfobacterota bacterium AH_259_B03_O07]|nr:phosphoglycerate kinase [Desulfobacterota bacterium AH_259_B03_O07]
MSITDYPGDFYKGKRVFLRVDFNVPIARGKVSEDYRIRRSMPTIEYLANRGAAVILGSHLGRPKGKVVRKLSLRPIAERLSEVLKVSQVKFVDDCIGKDVKYTVSGLEHGEVLLLENLRFHKEEVSNDSDFSKELASLADIYVNDAFSTSHRSHASTYGMTLFFNDRLAGLLVQKELDVLSKIRQHPYRPFIVIVGGAKIRDKINALKTLINKADTVLIGGGVAYTFLASKGISVGESPIERNYLKWAKEVLNSNKNRVLLPDDHVIAPISDTKGRTRLIQGQIPSGFIGLDIGQRTSKVYTHEIMSGEGTIFWNGPMGFFEKEEFSHGTIDIARAISLAFWRGANTVVGGGDTVAALRKAEVLETEVDFVSTGGGASLVFLGGGDLPGISVLSDKI